jgi:hypothetical protein
MQFITMQPAASVYIINKAAAAAPMATPAPETPTLAAAPVLEAEAAEPVPDPEPVEAWVAAFTWIP